MLIIEVSGLLPCTNGKCHALALGPQFGLEAFFGFGNSPQRNKFELLLFELLLGIKSHWIQSKCNLLWCKSMALVASMQGIGY